MRLRPDEVDAITSAAREAFGDDVVVRLFGSRVHDHLKGGDIDLHVELPGPESRTRGEIPFRVTLADRLDDEPVDVVVHARGTPQRWIDEVGYHDGLVL